MAQNDCEFCLYYAYDEESGEYVCDAAMDEDDYEKMQFSPRGAPRRCPCFRPGDEYTIVRKQN